jgi:uncharacterized protein (DUF2235 family)
MPVPEPLADRPPRNLVVFSDGTGNSAAKLFKTNVWRLYQALDLADGPAEAPDERRQLAFYDDGVGTSSFKPLAVLGGAFGWGLKRNVLDLYGFLCRNYAPGDRIYAFGFSRGAFTIRILLGLVVKQGLLAGCDEGELERYSRDAWRAYRRGYTQTGGHVEMLRNVRDRVVAALRRWNGHRPYAELTERAEGGCGRITVPEIAFVGAWDTVAAYGLPLAELTRGFDQWVYPLSMPNYVLSPKVRKACHALSLDDERDTFHPLIWDEVREAELEGVDPDRLEQVWFAGMHADVGGGYPDDGLAHVPLMWMIQKARAAKLRFKPLALRTLEEACCRLGPLHDSRRGLAGYYRYQPRKLSARMDPPDPTARIMRDPDPKRALLRSVKVHASVLARIAAGGDRYAPMVLPAAYEVVGGADGPREADPAARAARQEWVWNDIWHRRVNYFLTVGASLFLAAMPLIDRLVLPPAASCLGPQCALAPFFGALDYVLPGLAQPWIDAFTGHPALTLAAILVLVLLLLRGGSLQRRSLDRMRRLWADSLGLPEDSPRTVPAAPPGRDTSALFRLRTSQGYQSFFRALKWHLVPTAFGWSVLALGAWAIVSFTLVAAYRIDLAAAERWSDRVCGLDAPAPGEPVAEWRVDRVCWPTGRDVVEGQRYRVTVRVTEQWRDGRFAMSPDGTGDERLPWYLRFGGIPLRRSLNDPWFQPLVGIASDGGGATLQALDLVRLDAPAGDFVGEFRARRSGRLFLTVNDAILSWTGLTDAFYRNNSGRAAVAIEPLPDAQ